MSTSRAPPLTSTPSSRPLLHHTASTASLSKHRPRWALHVQAQVWRILMGIGMMLHKLARPRPPKPDFVRTVPTTLSTRKGRFDIYFYVPRDYAAQKRLREKKFPVVVNYHGGGFTLGTATDDARWAKAVVEDVGAIVASVNYRLAPEHSFPTAVEDGTDAILYLAEHSEELGIDLERIVVGGFSSGGNMSFTVPLRLQNELVHDNPSEAVFPPSSAFEHSGTVPQRSLSQGRMLANVNKEIKIKAICAWYPSTDYTQTREQRRMTNVRKDQELPAIFTALFDESYLQPPTLDMSHPYLSPGVAPREMLAGLPDDIILFTCQWDMLFAEGERLRDRLETECGKRVVYNCIPGVPHGWDKAPNPLRQTPGVQKYYRIACEELKRILA